MADGRCSVERMCCCEVEPLHDSHASFPQLRKGIGNLSFVVFNDLCILALSKRWFSFSSSLSLYHMIRARIWANENRSYCDFGVIMAGLGVQLAHSDDDYCACSAQRAQSGKCILVKEPISLNVDWNVELLFDLRSWWSHFWTRKALGERRPPPSSTKIYKSAISCMYSYVDYYWYYLFEFTFC